MASDISTEIRRADQRFHTRTEWLDSRHSFSFGPHYDPANTHFGLLMVNNEDVVAAGRGYDTHAHNEMEVLTWVLAGALVHRDSAGHSGVIHPGVAQRMSAGTGILHSEKSDAGHDVHFVQMWVVPDTEKIAPGYDQLDVGPALESGELLVVASGMPRHRHDSAISMRQEHAALYAARLAPGAGTVSPVAPLAHLFVARGSVQLEGAGVLGTGDAARITGADGQRVTAGPDGAEVLMWEMHATLG
ncbi:MAG TPA: pirin family protein [Pseudonocardia sp.]|jgi:redox-sensitive bicupin YhaK (pirin superfamily)|nr:pirin family protein [Pseudonocardia sp.]